jgi:hypothetical protein
MPGRTRKSTVSNSFPVSLQCRQKRYQLGTILFCRWAAVPEWCRCLFFFFYDAAVFLYSGIERNDTRNFREKKIFRVALSGSLEVKRVNHILYIICLYIIYSYIIFIYIYMVFCSCSFFSLMFYGINFLRPASGLFLYLVSKGCSVGCARNDNSVSFHHAMFAHQCRNSEKYGINFFPYSSYWVRQQDALKCILKVRMFFNLRHFSASAMLTKKCVELPKR